ncbi:unnamed protein product [Caenorhabditis nigoni]
MIYQIFLVLSTSAWCCLAGLNETVLSPFIEKSASLARISATISIHNGIFANNSTVQEVVAEFLEISPFVAKELLEHDYHSLSASIQKFYSSLSQISPDMKNGDELIETLGFLSDMKVNQEYLKPGKIVDPTKHFSRTTEIMENSISNGYEMLETDLLKTSVELLRKVLKSDGQNMKRDEIEDILSDLDEYLILVGSQLDLIINYKTVLKDYLSLESLSNDLQNVANAARIAKKYSETVEKLDTFRKDIIGVSKKADGVEEAIKEIQKFFEKIQNLVSTSIVLNSTVHEYEEKVLTHGLLSHKDLMMFGKDFENPWFQKNVLSNLDPAVLKNGLEDLEPFVDALETLISVKDPIFATFEEKIITLDLVKNIGDLSKLGSEVLNVSNIKSRFEEISKCVEPLQPFQNLPDQDMLQRVVDFSGEVVENVKTFSKLMDEVNEIGLANIITVSEEIVTNIEYVKWNKNGSWKIEMWDKARKLEQQHSLAEKFQMVADVLSKDPGHLFLEDRTIDYKIIRSISSIFKGTNVDSVLNCIQMPSVENLIEILGFIKTSHVLKDQETDFKTASNFIASISEIQNKYQEINSLVKTCNLTKESFAMMKSDDLQRLRNVSVTIGKGVTSMRDLDNILKEEKSIMSVANAEIPYLDSQFDDSYQKKLATIPNMVENLTKTVESSDLESMKDLENVFATLSKNEISKLNIPTKFLQKIGLNLSNNSNPENQTVSQDFEIVSNLDMNFAKHSMAFGGIQRSLELTKEFLAEFLKNQTDIVKPLEDIVDTLDT